MFRQILTKVGIYSLVPVVTRGASFLLLPIYTRALTPADYGVMELLDLTSNLIGLILGSRIGQALFYFYFACKTDEERDTCISCLYLASALMGVLCGCMMFASNPLSVLVFGHPGFSAYLKLVFASFAISVVAELNLCYLRAKAQAGRYVAAMLFTLLLNVVISLVLLLVFRLGIGGVLIAGLVSSATSGIWLAYSSLSQIRFHLDGRLLVRLVRYSIPLSVGSLAIFAVHYGDRLFLRPEVSLAQLGIYSLAYKFAMLVPNCHLPFILHWNAQVGAILSKPEGRSIYIRTCTYLTAGMILVGVTLSLFIRPVLSVMAAPAFSEAAALVPLLAAAYVIRAIGAHLQSVFIAEGRPGLEARVSIVGAVVCIGAYAVLIPPFKLWGAIAATLLGFITILVYGLYEAQRLRHFQFEYSRVARLMVLGCIAVGTSYFIPVQGLCTESLIATLLTCAFAAAAILTCTTFNERTGAVTLLREVWNRTILRAAV